MGKSIELLIGQMQDALASKRSEQVEASVSEFTQMFRTNAASITGKEFGLHIAARCFAWLGDKENALEFIRLCEWNDYENFSTIADDEMFASIKDDKEFKSIFS
jgi:hypothetical protein